MYFQVQDIVSKVSVVKLNEKIDAVSAPQIKEKFNEMISDGVYQFVLDLSQVPFMDSAGLAALVSLLKQARQENGDVKLVAPQNESAMRILKLTKFDRVFDMANTAESAVALF
ncbi:MAG: STAS domain-containing protein [Chloroflexota bacterium]